MATPDGPISKLPRGYVFRLALGWPAESVRLPLQRLLYADRMPSDEHAQVIRGVLASLDDHTTIREVHDACCECSSMGPREAREWVARELLILARRSRR
jgi:hypothetical protein